MNFSFSVSVNRFFTEEGGRKGSGFWRKRCQCFSLEKTGMDTVIVCGVG